MRATFDLLWVAMEDAPIHDAATSKPKEYLAVRVEHADGSTGVAVWTGLVWWGSGDKVEVTRWQELPPSPGYAVDGEAS